MHWFDEICINFDSINMNDCGRTIDCTAPVLTYIATKGVILIIRLETWCTLCLYQLKMKIKASLLYYKMCCSSVCESRLLSLKILSNLFPSKAAAF